jgi:membrane protein implicated in regulation of membrane protease activity
MNFLADLDPLLQTFWYIALPTSLVFVLQTIMTFVGSDASDGLQADFEGDLGDSSGPFQLFSFRNLVHFLLGFSWTGISFYSSISHTGLLIFLALLVGLLFVYLFLFIIRQLQKLSEDNSFKLTEALDKTAEVYLSIPGEGKGKGKVMLSVRGSFKELEAITKQETLQTGAVVKVTGIQDNILIVESI